MVNITPAVTADARFSVASVGDPLEIGDIVKTAPDTVAAIQFVIGGRVAINVGSAVRIVSERSVTDIDHNYWALIRGIPSHFNFLKNRETILIQTNGGVMGIKG